MFIDQHSIPVSLDGISGKHLPFVTAMQQWLRDKRPGSKNDMEKLAARHGITDKHLAKELTELALVMEARRMAHTGNSIEEKFRALTVLYERQVHLSHRTSTSIKLQQYSTPAPISYLAGVFAGAHLGVSVFEPSAGNGLLTIAGLPKNIVVNEIDPIRRKNLEAQNYKEVLGMDAFRGFPEPFRERFDAVLTNPPFDRLNEPVMFGTFPIWAKEQVMALRALETMKGSGRAAIIIGGHIRWDAKGRIKYRRERIFYNYLFSRYHVADIIPIDGNKLYARQGTTFDVSLLLIAGKRSSPQGAAPLYNALRDSPVKSFPAFYKRMSVHFTDTPALSRILQLETHFFQLSGHQNLSGMKRLNAAKALKKIYKASDCTDMRDVQLAIEDLRVLFRQYEKAGKKPSNEMYIQWYKLHKRREAFEALQGPYIPTSESCFVLDTIVPDSMDFEIHQAMKRLEEAVDSPLNVFVAARLNYTDEELCKAFSAEQIDAVAMLIHNIEYRQAAIIGDQTGIGKGRVAAAMIRYGVIYGLQPIFLSEKPNLFSDIYRDLSAIGSADLVPFIVNARDAKTHIKDANGNIVYEALSPAEQNAIFKSKRVPRRFNYVVATYSQFNSPETKPLKPDFLRAIAPDNILIMDESHNASGSSNTGAFLQNVVRDARGVAFLSATFAKRPDNMPIYAMKTKIADANMTKDELVKAIVKGGVALQEILSSQLVQEGQMLRRERSFEGVEVNYIYLDAEGAKGFEVPDKEQEHRAIADNITALMRDIIDFQLGKVQPVLDEWDDVIKSQGKELHLKEGTVRAGIDNMPYFSKVFNVINQMLFAIKAEAVALRAIQRLKEGKKPVIAFSSTMGSFLESLENNKGLPVSEGDVINADFATVLKRGLEGVLRYTERNMDGTPEHKMISLDQLGADARERYMDILRRIEQASSGISISPIDVIIQKIEQAGYSVAEVTGRKLRLQVDGKRGTGMVMSRKKLATNDAFRLFNNNEVDVLMINQAGSTGASAHAVPTDNVPEHEVKQRVMIVLQAELDINREVQKRGRINRTGQIYKPIYDYIISSIPAEKRLMMMLQQKLKSLDANTSSNQKQSRKILSVEDFLNKFGDKVVKEYLDENPEIDQLLDKPLKSRSGEENDIMDAAKRVSGRVAVLSTQQQQSFYGEISERYRDYVDYLQQVGEYDLEVEVLNLEAETVRKQIIKAGTGGKSVFGNNTYLETIKANVLRKPFSKRELDNLIREALKDKDAPSLQKELAGEFKSFMERKLQDDLEANERDFAQLMKYEKEADKLAELRESLQKANEMSRTLVNNRTAYLLPILQFFFVGRGVLFPLVGELSGATIYQKAVFLGFMIDRKKKNPFLPSALKLRFAIADSNKYVAIPASYLAVDVIKSRSMDMLQWEQDEIVGKWDEWIQESSVNRRSRFMLTGNLLQAFSDHNGKLVSYSLLGGGEKKGILLPEHWELPEKMTVSVPIIQAAKLVRSMVANKIYTTNQPLRIGRTYSAFRLMVPAPKRIGGKFYLHEPLLELVIGQNFNKSGNDMVAEVSLPDIDKVIEVLQKDFKVSVLLSDNELKFIEDQLPQDMEKEAVAVSMPKIIELEARFFAESLKQVAGLSGTKKPFHPRIKYVGP